MQASLILVALTIIALVISYFILIWTIDLLHKIVKNSRDALKSIFVLVGFLAIIWIFANKEQSPYILMKVQNWNMEIKDIDAFNLDLY